MAQHTKGIFISYRRGDTTAYAGWLAERLGNHFGEQKVFRDIGSVEPGADFVEDIERAVEACGVMLVVIGNSWGANLVERRKAKRDDYTRLEIATALKRNIRVIPVLVQGASMPDTEELPNDLAPLARRNAFELHDSSWGDDVRRLITTLEKGQERRSVEEKDMSTQRTEGLLARVKRLVYRVGLVRGIILLIVLFIVAWLSAVLVHMALHPELYFY
jgi:hypothetical protein